MDPKTKKENGSQEPLSPATGAVSFFTRLRGAWHSRRPKWYARMIPGQQHVIDKLVSLRLEEFQTQLVELDREDSELSHQIAELSTQITQMNRLLRSIEQRVANLEKVDTRSGSPVEADR